MTSSPQYNLQNLRADRLSDIAGRHAFLRFEGARGYGYSPGLNKGWKQEMHARADASEHQAAQWPEDIFAILQRHDVRQVPYVPDAGHSQLINRVLGSATMRGEWGEFNPWQVPMGTSTQGVFELSGIRVLRATEPDEVKDVMEAAASQAYNACTPTALLLSQRLIGTKVFIK